MRLRALHRVESHRCRIAAHLLLYDRHSGAFAPYLKLLDGGCTECVCRTEHHLVSGTHILTCELSYGGGLAHSVDTHHHNHVRLTGLWHLEISEFLILGTTYVLGKKVCNLFAKKIVKLFRTEILVAGHTGFKTLYDLKRSVHAYIACYECLLQVVKNLVIYLALAGYSTRYLVPHTCFGLLKAGVKFLFFLA